MATPRSFTAGSLLQLPTGEVTHGVRVDNNGAQYLYEPLSGIFIPPNTAGWQFPARPYSTFLLLYEAPQGLAQPALVANAVITITELEEEVKSPVEGSPANPGGVGTSAPSVSPGARGATLNTNQVSCPTTANGALIIAANANRFTVTIKNTDASNPVAIAQTGAGTATGHQLAAQDAVTFSNYTGPLYGVATGAAVVVSYAEEAP